MLVGVCDFPGSYAFPPAGYGGIERWLWAVAAGARAAGADVHLLGPGWLTDLENNWVRKPVRLEDITAGSLAERELRGTGYDLLVVGHSTPRCPPGPGRGMNWTATSPRSSTRRSSSTPLPPSTASGHGSTATRPR